MGPLQFIVTFIGIIIKGCMESPAIKAALILLFSIAAFISIPHWVGLLVVGSIFPPPAWAGGMICIILVAFITLIVVVVYMGIYECIKNKMMKKDREKRYKEMNME